MVSGRESDDGHEAASHVLPDLLADLNFQPSNSRFASSQSPWPATASSSRSSPSIYGGRPTTLLPRRTSSSRAQPQTVSDLDISGPSSQAGPSNTQAPTLFTTPNRSIFSSGPPTASVSANTAHASMSSPQTPNLSNPLSALTAPHLGSTKRPTTQVETTSSPRNTRFTGVEKDADDPSSPIDQTHSRRRQMSTPTALSNIFAAPAEPSSPPISRHGSYIRTPSGTHYVKAMSNETAPLPSHLYREGLLSGRHSDITIHTFGTRYPLHRLLLDRAPFFRSAFSEPWHESTARDINLHPEEIDANITKTAFELALKRIYGCHTLEEEDREAISLFATGCWLEMMDLIESSVNSILKQMTPSNIARSIQLVTGNYYGKHGDKILAAAKAMLCREGWEMPLRYYDGISGEIIREIIGCDGFYVPTEWNRFVTAKRILNRRLKAVAIEAGLINARAEPIVPRPDSLKFMSVRFDAVYRSTFAAGTGNASGSSDRWLAVYTTPDIAPLLVLLDEGIHYMHLNFEQLQRIRESRDVLGLPLIPEKVISNALWASLELRQHIVNATETELELGLSHEIEEDEEGEEGEANDETLVDGLTDQFSRTMSERVLGKKKEIEDEDDEEDEMDSGSWDGNGKPRKFWIPLADATFPLGGDLEPVVPQSPPPSSHGHRSRISAVLDPQDLQWAADFGSSAQERSTTPVVSNSPSPEVAYTHYPPFRFAVEFPPARSLKEHKRVYSSTVWYAGSLWNVYVQKKETAKGTQLGIYLHRERQVDGNPDLLANILHNSSNERISHLQREALLGRPSRRNVSEQVYSSEDGDTTLLGGPNAADLDTLSGVLQQNANDAMKSSEASLSPSTARRFGTETPRTEDEREDTRANEKKYRVSTLPPYVDARPTIKTYFKIYTPSKGGRVLSVYESAPDKFNFSQSWGWKSSNLVLDDSVGEVVDEGKKDPRLRFMVVIGNV